MTELVFAQPFWLWGLLALVPLLGLRIWSHFRGRESLSGLVSPRLLNQLVSGHGQSQKWTLFLLQSLALGFTFAALARPQLGYDEIDTQIEARNLILAIDTSRSMLATDLRPNRLERAKLAATDIIRALPEDRIGLIAFAGRPFLQAPLTVDHEAIIEAVEQMDTEIIPRGGTNIAAAAQLALETFEESKLEQSALVLFSDGEALEGTDQAERIRELSREARMAIIAVGVGTKSGAIIPELDDRSQPVPGEFVMDEEGQVVRSRLDPEALQALASGGGVYVHLGGQSSLTRVVQQIQREIATSREDSETRRRPKERFVWPLSIAVGLLILSHLVPVFWRKPAPSRRSLATQSRPAGSVLTPALGILFALTTALAAEDPLFLGHEAYEQGDYGRAIETYEEALTETLPSQDGTLIQMALGAAAFRQGDYEKAGEAYGRALIGSRKSLQEQAHYNLGNTLFRKGESALQATSHGDPDQPVSVLPPEAVIDATIQEWESAIEHYKSALSLNERNEKATHNIEVVKRRIEELKKQQEQEQEQPQKEQKKDEKEKNEEEQKKEENNETSPDSSDGESDSSEPGEQAPEDQSDDPKENDNSKENSEPKEDDPGESQGENEPRDQREESPGEGTPENENQNPEPDDSEPREGDLEADPNRQQPPGQMNGGPGTQAQQVNPETGYSPSEARQLLEALADETEVRPILAPARGENYKNW